MKKFVFIIFMIISVCCSLAVEMNLKLNRIDVDFNGVVNSDTSILCYGTGSNILYSYDNGMTWEQECIHNDSLDIKQIVFNKFNYFALLTRDYFVIGDKDAKKWKSFYTGIPIQQSIEAQDDLLYILGNKQIYVFKNFELIEEFNLIDTVKFKELKIFDGQLIVSGEKGKIIVIELNNFNQKIIDLKELGLCSNCGTLHRMRIDKDQLYINDGGEILKTIDLINWTIAGRNLSLSEVHNDSIFDLKAINTKNLQIAMPAFYLSFRDSNLRISNDWVQRNVDILMFTAYKFIDDSVIVAVGREKLIALSKDKGINWILISNFKPNTFKVINDSIYYSVQSKGRIYRTLNAGITWLPPLFTDTLMSRLHIPRYSEFNNDGYGFIISQEPENLKNLLQTYDYGNSYTLKNIKNLSGYMSANDPSFIKTNEGYNIILPRGISKEPLTTLVKLDTGLNFVSWKDIYDSIQIRSIKKINDKEYLAFAADEHWPYYIDGIEKEYNYWFLKSIDDGETWEKQFEIFMSDTLLGTTINKFDSQILMGGTYFYKQKNETPNVNQLFMIDMDTGERTRIFNDVVASYSQITEYKEYLIFGGWEYLFVNTSNKKNLLNWEKLSVKNLYISSIDYQFEKLFFNTFDINTYQTHVYQVKLDFVTGTDAQSEIKTYLYSYPPYPNPAHTIVMTYVFWDTRYDIDNADIGVFNYTGIKIAGRENISIGKNNNYSGILSCNCSAYPPGVYFIIIHLGEASRVIPVVVGE